METAIDPEGRVTVVARAAGPLHYPARGVVEHVRADSLADGLESLIGVNVERSHNGPVIGRVISARVDGDRIVCDLDISDLGARQDIASGNLNEASADYDIGRLDADGVQYGPFRYRALALIPPGVSRCGPACSIQARADALGCACSASGAKEIPTMKITIAGKEYTSGTPEAAEAMAAEGRRLDALAGENTRLRSERSTRIRLDAVRAGVTARKDADDTTVMQEVIAKVFPSLDLSSQSPDWISGAFAAAIASLLGEDSEDAEPGTPPPAPPKPGEPPAMGAAGAAGARADAMDGRAAGAKSQETPTADPPDVAARNAMIRRGQRLATKEA